MHNERKKKAYKSNPDIKTELSSLNYHLIDPAGNSYNQFISARLEEAGVKRIRKDSVRFQDAIVTASPEFFSSIGPREQELFFERALEFYTKRFGRENFISAVVHLDESTPHMHFEFVPITKDGRLSSKEIIGGPKGLVKLQDDFYDYMSKLYPSLVRGISKEITNREHLNTESFKNAAELTHDMNEMYRVVNGMGFMDLDAKERKKVIIEELNTILPKAAKYESQMKQAKKYINELNYELNYQSGIIEKQNQKILTLEKTISQLKEELSKVKEILSSIPEYIIQQFKPHKERIKSKDYELSR